ncbi:MAG: hypothetical protein GPJ51_02315 [Candidatus Heimdallarchaeota archaeon]|nr:hypothetical protein [Candidatus Heimdallarchaeota archaeon]
MEVFRTGKYHFSDLDKFQELQPLESAKRTILKRLNYLIGFMMSFCHVGILTMEHIIVAGDSYCSCILHDTRINDDLTHPSKEFFDNMWSLKEHQ